MIKKIVVSIVLPGALLLSIGIALAANEGQTQQTEQIEQQAQMMEQDSQSKQIYGWELMTPGEQAKHLEKMQNFQTEEERKTYRQELQKLIQKRAEEQGITLTESPSK